MSKLLSKKFQKVNPLGKNTGTATRHDPRIAWTVMFHPRHLPLALAFSNVIGLRFQQHLQLLATLDHSIGVFAHVSTIWVWAGIAWTQDVPNGFCFVAHAYSFMMFHVVIEISFHSFRNMLGLIYHTHLVCCFILTMKAIHVMTSTIWKPSGGGSSWQSSCSRGT